MADTQECSHKTWLYVMGSGDTYQCWDCAIRKTRDWFPPDERPEPDESAAALEAIHTINQARKA